jgi:hypothetical protein
MHGGTLPTGMGSPLTCKAQQQQEATEVVLMKNIVAVTDNTSLGSVMAQGWAHRSTARHGRGSGK